MKVKPHLYVIARIPRHVKAALDTIKRTQGIPIQYQVQAALEAYVAAQASR
jgi:hypothetical protein